MSIIFGTKLNGRSGEAAEAAARLSARLGQPLHLIHVSQEARAAFVIGTPEERLLGGARAALRAEADALSAATGCAVEIHLSAGDVAEALAALARLELATLICVAGRPSGSRSLIGDIAERLARIAPAPLLLLRQPERIAAWLDGQRALRVLVGADHGQAALAARALAVRLSAVAPCEVEVVYVALPRELHQRLGLAAPPNEHTLSEEARAAAQRDLERCAPAGEQATLRVVPSPVEADAQLVMWADEGAFDLVLVGQRRSSLLEQLWYGSVARGVLHRSPVNVACVPAAPDAALRRAQRPAIVLVGVDLSQDSQRAIALASALIAEGGALHLVTVLADGDGSRHAAGEAWYALSRLSPVGASLQVERHVVHGEPAAALLALAARCGAELIVLAGRGQTTVSHLLLGSVADAVAAATRVPLLLVPPLPG